MGFLDRFRKEEVYNRESGRFEPKQHEIKELTREEQMIPQRMHPWQTPRGKQVVRNIKGGVKKIDHRVVRHNRRSRPSFGYSTHSNYNPFGTMFDTGMSYKTKRKSQNVRYAVVGGRAYPVATSKKKKKKHSPSFGNWDIMDNWGF